MTKQTVMLTLAACVLILVLAERACRIFRPRPSRLDQPVIFFLVVCGCILVLRWPEIIWPQGINLDEAQTFAQAMRFCAHPVPWRDVDGNTSGPFTSMLLSVPLNFGAPVAWQTARLMLWALNSLTLVFLYLALRVFGTRPEAQFVLTPVILFYAFTLDPNFAHYSNETLPVLLLSVGIWLLCREWDAPRSSRVRMFFLGLVCGSLPFTKLQAGPLGFFLFAIGLVQLVARRRQARLPLKACWPEAGLLCVGGVTTSMLLLGWVAARGAISDFWISYILEARAYSQKTSANGRLAHIWYLFTTGSDFRPYFFCALAAFVVLLWAVFSRRAKLGDKLFWPLLVVLLDGVLTTLCILIAGQAFLHYTLLLVPVIAMFLGLAFFAGRQLLGCAAGPESPPTTGPSCCFLVASVLVMFLPDALRPVKYVREVGLVYPPESSLEISVVTDRLRSASQTGDSLGIWGWMPSYYVESGVMPATRDAVSDFAISNGPYQKYFRARFLADLEQSRPAFFIDAVSDGAFLGANWTRADGHEGFPELAAFVDENYSLWWTIHLTANGVPLRIYALKDRLAELHLSPNNVESFSALQPSAQTR